MKTSRIQLSCLFIHALLLVSLISFAGEQPDSVAPINTRLLLNYLCKSTDSVVLTATLDVRKGEVAYNLKNALIEFQATDGLITKSIGKVATNQEGNAILGYSISGLPFDKNGSVTYRVLFAATSKYTGAEASFTAKPAKISLSFTTQDSLHILDVTATTKDNKGSIIPVTSTTVNIYVPRLFSLLKIGEVSLDEKGTGTLEFPKEIVGDTLGNLVVLARIEENDLFGFVQGQDQINWGVHKQYYKAEVPSRELWTPVAPLWMIITLIIMLLGVWAHYIYAVFELIMIKLSGKNSKTGY